VTYIREIARNLYILKRRMEELERLCDSESAGEKRSELELELKKARLEHEKVKRILEGAKESPGD
jgi:DNA-binding transcriptional regulator GbsR (MarR family)